MQCAFRKQRSTTDYLVRLECFVREAFAQRQHAVGVFFDLEKAYESTWKFGIMLASIMLVCVADYPSSQKAF